MDLYLITFISIAANIILFFMYLDVKKDFLSSCKDFKKSHSNFIKSNDNFLKSNENFLNLKAEFQKSIGDRIKPSEAVYIFCDYLCKNKNAIVFFDKLSVDTYEELINDFLEKFQLSEAREGFKKIPINMRCEFIKNYEVFYCDDALSSFDDSLNDLIKKYCPDANSNLAEYIFVDACDLFISLECDLKQKRENEIDSLKYVVERYASMKVSDFQIESHSMARDVLKKYEEEVSQ